MSSDRTTQPEPQVPALDAQQLAFNYGSHKALQGVSLQVPVGEFVALLGANGAGKTTLFSIITGLYSATTGSVSVMGHDLRQNTLRALSKMGVVFQRTTLDMDLTIKQNLYYTAALQGIARSEVADRVAKGLQQHGLAGLEKRKVTALSGGQRRRVELARALLHEPALLLLDEPTVGLDMQSRAEFVAHVKQLCETRQTGVLWATHLMDEVTSDNRLYVLDKGSVIATGPATDLMAEHKVETVAQLFGQLVSAGPRA